MLYWSDKYVSQGQMSQPKSHWNNIISASFPYCYDFDYDMWPRRPQKNLIKDNDIVKVHNILE